MVISVKPPKKNILQSIHLTQLVLALFGLVVSVYLLWHHTQVKLGVQDSLSFCTFGKISNCDVVNASRFSEIGGVPLAALGVAYFAALFIFGLFFSPSKAGFKLSLQLMTGLAALALVFDLFLLIQVQWLTLRSFCLMCILTYFANLGHLTGGVLLLRNPTLLNVKRLNSDREGRRWLGALMSVSLCASLSVWLPPFLFIRADSVEQNQSTLKEFIVQWDMLPTVEIPVSESDGSYGNKNAPLKIILFSDFQCPFCRKTAFQLHAILPSFKDKVWVAFKHFPLNPNCNPAVTQMMHPHACSLAKLAFCANQKGKFWDFHDAVFFKLKDEDFSDGWDKLRNVTSTIFQDNQIELCLASPEAEKQINSDVATGLKIGIEGTPALFINGRSISFFLDAQGLNEILKQVEKGPQ